MAAVGAAVLLVRVISLGNNDSDGEKIVGVAAGSAVIAAALLLHPDVGRKYAIVRIEN